jgi:hypothetical protein
MTIFDLLFLALAFSSVVTLLMTAVLALSGKGSRAAAILKTWGVCFAGYMTVVVMTSVFQPRREAAIGEALCSDDWCLAVVGAQRVPEGYRVGLRIESRAGRVTQREYGVSVYLTDAEGRRWEPRVSAADVPFDVPIRPQQTIETARLFDLPAGVRLVGLVVRHGSGFPIGWFIIGYETWFRKPTIVRL